MILYDEHVQNGTPVTQIVNRGINPLAGGFTLYIGGFGGAGTQKYMDIDQGDEITVTSWQLGDDNKTIWLTGYLLGDNESNLYAFPIDANHKFDYSAASQAMIKSDNQGATYYDNTKNSIPDIFGWFAKNIKTVGIIAASAFLLLTLSKRKAK